MEDVATIKLHFREKTQPNLVVQSRLSHSHLPPISYLVSRLPLSDLPVRLKSQCFATLSGGASPAGVCCWRKRVSGRIVPGDILYFITA